MVDERAVSLALAAIAGDDMPRCVNLCAASLGDRAFRARLRSLLRADAARSPASEPRGAESAAIDHFEWCWSWAANCALAACASAWSMPVNA